MDQLQGRPAVITGAASGIGLAMAERFAAEGMHLVLADIDAVALATAAESLRTTGVTVTEVVIDAGKADDIERLADTAFARHGEVAVLCQNAGVTKRAWSWDLTLADWQWVMDVNMWSVIHGIRFFVPRMIAQGAPAHIVNTGSITGLLPLTDVAAYAVSKTAVTAITEVLALDLAAQGADIGVSLLAPGYIATNIATNSRAGAAALPETATSDRPRNTTSIEARLTAADVAEQVLDAVRSRRFWILTHQEYRPVIVERAQGIGTDAQPESFPVW